MQLPGIVRGLLAAIALVSFSAHAALSEPGGAGSITSVPSAFLVYVGLSVRLVKNRCPS